MSNSTQIARILRPFLERHGEFELVGRSVVLKPVRHVMREFFIDRTSIKGYIQPSWRISTMFGAPPGYGAKIGARLVQGVGFVDREEMQTRLFAEMEHITAEVLKDAEDMTVWPAWHGKQSPFLGLDH